ncbi:hypothetical protein N8I77_000225 [Diaporthe amygdali]|uniref:NAD(P)-binding protein n=1 Tax=Phomopsis amygdali TaxID=1214568 RepID=A0AAD9SP50_PHOAM|nr:hypothetical protein N8I77_000225 [Diaporthe amygdali]
MSSTPVILIFGAGANTGLATAKKFAKEGYKVAAVSRNPSTELKAATDLIVPADLTDPKTVETVFEKVTKELGVPHVVVFSAADGQMVSGANPITVSTARLTETLTVSTISPYAAARLAIKGWATLPASAAKAFLFVGNMMNTQVFPETHILGMAKNATAYFIETAAEAYKRAGKDYKFYYVDERLENGESCMMDIDGESHALEFWKLAHEVEGQSHWCWTFVKGDAAKGETGRYVRNRAYVDREYRLMKDFGLPDLSNVPEGGMSYRELMGMMESGEFAAKK